MTVQRVFFAGISPTVPGLASSYINFAGGILDGSGNDHVFGTFKQLAVLNVGVEISSNLGAFAHIMGNIIVSVNSNWELFHNAFQSSQARLYANSGVRTESSVGLPSGIQEINDRVYEANNMELPSFWFAQPAPTGTAVGQSHGMGLTERAPGEHLGWEWGGSDLLRPRLGHSLPWYWQDDLPEPLTPNNRPYQP